MTMEVNRGLEPRSAVYKAAASPQMLVYRTSPTRRVIPGGLEDARLFRAVKSHQPQWRLASSCSTSSHRLAPLLPRTEPPSFSRFLASLPDWVQRRDLNPRPPAYHAGLAPSPGTLPCSGPVFCHVGRTIWQPSIAGTPLVPAPTGRLPAHPRDCSVHFPLCHSTIGLSPSGFHGWVRPPAHKHLAYPRPAKPGRLKPPAAVVTTVYGKLLASPTHTIPCSRTKVSFKILFTHVKVPACPVIFSRPESPEPAP